MVVRVTVDFCPELPVWLVLLQAGKPARCAFTLSPSSLLVPAGGTGTLTVTGDPSVWLEEEEAHTHERKASLQAVVTWASRPATSDSTTRISFRDYIDGDAGAAVLSGDTGSGEPVPGLALTIRLLAVLPYLHVDKREGGGLKWGVWATVPAGHPSFTRQVTLTNTLATTLTFTLGTQGPFTISNAASNAPASGGNSVMALRRSLSSAPTTTFTLLPATNVVVDIVFVPASGRGGPAPTTGGSVAADVPSAGPYSAFGSTVSADPFRESVYVSRVSSKVPVPLAAAPPPLAPGAGATGSAGGLCDYFSGALTVLFATGNTQSLGLRCQRLRPALVATPPVIHFGTVHVEARGNGSITLTNPTAVDAEWEVRHMPTPARRALSSSASGANWVASLGLSGKPGLSLSQPGAGEGGGEVPVDDPSVFHFSAISGCLQGGWRVIQRSP